MSESKTNWITLKPEEVKQKIIEFAKKGISPEKIGLMLRDQQGIPKTSLLGLRIKKVLEEAKLWQDPELKNMNGHIEKLKKHASNHKHDYTAKRSLIKRTANFALRTKKR